jgi:cell division septation protein DedD
MLLAIFFGLVLLCGLCFGLGYSVGHRGSQQPVAAAQPVDNAPPAVQVSAAAPKPSADKQSGTGMAAATTAPDAGDGQAGDSAADKPAAASAQGSQPVAGTGVPASPSATTSTQVKPALVTPPQARPVAPAATNPQPAAGFASGARVQPALPPQAAFMVQIAAVSHPDDASVLVNALRKRGYTVTAQRKPEDGLIHVWIGPFSTRDEANRWKQKLLDDGYNAIVQP